MSEMNRQITLASRPVGFPIESDFELVEASVPAPEKDQVLVRTEYLSVDPYMRGRMNDAHGYASPYEIGKVMGGGTVGSVVESNHPQFSVGEVVSGMWGWQDYGLSGGAGLRKVDPTVAPISTSLGVLGMPGLSAYFGLLDICDPKAGETVFVSGAAGAVGELVGQIAKIKGCRVVGSAGSDEKVKFLLEENGLDAAFNYKTTDNYRKKIQELCPNGVNVYFDNVGGEMTDAVLMNLSPFARVSVCGAISQYNLTKAELGPRLLSTLIVTQSRIEGFLVTRFMDKYDEGISQMAQWLDEGKLRVHETIAEGLENTPKAFIGMLNGENKGKQLVKV